MMKIVIVNSHPVVRKGLSAILSTESDNEIVGEAENVSGALELIGKVKPSIAIIDFRLKREDGLDIIIKAKKQELECKFLILASSAEQEDFKRAEESGVDGYILEEALPEELLYAVRIVSRGKKYYDPEIMEHLMSSKNSEAYVEKLTPRERDVLEVLGHGLKNNEIAKKLFITEYTVKKHVSQILYKLELTDRTQAALYVNNKGLIKYQY